MFKRDNQINDFMFVSNIQSHIANSSLEDQYVNDLLGSLNNSSKFKHQIDQEIDDYMLFAKNSQEENRKYDKLVSMIEKGFERLSKDINSLNSSQNIINDTLKIRALSKPLDSELDFNSRPHPFKTFEETELPKLTNIEKSRYNECLIESKSNVALAYFLFKNNHLSRSSNAAARSCFVKFI